MIRGLETWSYEKRAENGYTDEGQEQWNKRTRTKVELQSYLTSRWTRQLNANKSFVKVTAIQQNTPLCKQMPALEMYKTHQLGYQ